MNLPKTIILDIDGCVLRHEGEGACHQWRPRMLELGQPGEVLPDVREKLDAWERAGHYIVLMTSRKESCRRDLEEDLRNANLFWDLLIMGVPHGERVIVNDAKRGGVASARAVVVERNAGLGGVEL